MIFLPYRGNRVEHQASILVLRAHGGLALWSAYFSPKDPIPDIPADITPPYTVELVWHEPKVAET
jgi:hypothetical protein